MDKIEDIKVIEENKPTEQAKEKIEQLSIFLSKNWIINSINDNKNDAFLL